MMIAGKDRLETLKLRKRIKRKDRQNEFQILQAKVSIGVTSFYNYP